MIIINYDYRIYCFDIGKMVVYREHIYVLPKIRYDTWITTTGWFFFYFVIPFYQLEKTLPIFCKRSNVRDWLLITGRGGGVYKMRKSRV